MFGFIYLIIIICAVAVSGTKKWLRDIDFKVSDNTKFPFYTDSTGNYRWKHNNEIIYGVVWDSEGHTIITDKKFNRIDWTWLELKKKLDASPGHIFEYGRDMHNHDKVPGKRYIVNINGTYRYLVVIRYEKILYWFDVETEKILQPIETNRYTDEEIKRGKEALEKMSWIQRNSHIERIGYFGKKGESYGK